MFSFLYIIYIFLVVFLLKINKWIIENLRDWNPNWDLSNFRVWGMEGESDSSECEVWI